MQAVVLDDSTPPGAVHATAPECVLLVGNFDGVHRGHAAVIEQAVAVARARGLAPAVLTFEPHPAGVVGQGAPPLLTTIERRVELFRRLGVERTYVRTFDRGFAAWPPDRFVRDLVNGELRARVVMVGQNFRFGARRAGDLAMLERLGHDLGFEVRVHALVKDEHGEPLSSSRARMAIAAGEMERATRVLGRMHAISGLVVAGDKIGRTLGFPTANVEEVAEMLPPDGVYATVVDEIAPDGGARALARGALSIGVRPTLEGEPRRLVEVYLLDFARDLYGARLRVHLHSKLRDQEKLPSLDALKERIRADVDEVAARTAEIHPAGVAFG